MKNLEFNPKVKEIIRECKINMDYSLTYLLSIYHNLNPTFFPSEFKNVIEKTGIIFIGDNGLYEWKIPLFKGQETAFEWVKDYCNLFKEANVSKGGKVREATLRMKKMFSENPEIRKDDVIKATKYYIFNTSDATYLMMPHYFISKGTGAAKTSSLLDWIDKFKEVNTTNTVRQLDQTMQ